jgi:Ferritin-like domain
MSDQQPSEQILSGSGSGTGIGRRDVLRAAGFTVVATGVIAACGGTESPGVARVGVAPTTTKLPDAAISDAVLLRTAASLERSVIGIYDAVLEAGWITGAAADAARRFRDDHAAHAESLDALTTEVGGTPWSTSNPRIDLLLVQPMLLAITGDSATDIEPSDDPTRDALNVAHGFETLAGATYQAMVPMLSVPSLRRESMLIGGDEARHASVLALAITGRPGGYFNFDPPAEPPTIPPVFAIPGQFGVLGTTTIVIGKEDAVGTRQSFNLETPSLNTLIYEYMTP